MSQTADGAEVTLDSGDTIKAQYVVAADGMNSNVRDLAGLGRDGDDALPLSFALADVRVDGGLPADQVLLFFSIVAYAQRLLNTRGPRRTAVSVTEVIWGSRFRIHERVRTSTGPGGYSSPATPHIRTARQVGKA